MIVIDFIANGGTSNILRVFLYKDAGATAGTEGDPITGLTHGSTGLSISSVAENEATAITETVAGTDDVEDITTLGTYAAPTAGKVRFKEVDATAHPGLYEVQFADARFAVSNARYLDICVTGVADLATMNGRVYLDLSTAADIKEEVRVQLEDTAIGGAPTSGSVAERVATMDDAYTAARAVFLDNLDFTLESDIAAAQAATDALNNITAASVWAVQCEDQGAGYTAQEIMSLLLAEAAGTAVYTSGTRTWVVKDPSGTETRLTVIYSAELDGDRSTSTPAPMTP